MQQKRVAPRHHVPFITRQVGLRYEGRFYLQSKE